ncbi:MAG: universal stress protein [Pseudomonadota bacterium]
MAPKERRFRILVCIDGSDESYRGLRYATRIGSGVDADITLLYIRPVDLGLSGGGLEARLTRENMLEWGLELPGMKALKKARDMLLEMGVMQENWEARTIHTEVRGDPLGDNMTEYTGDDGKQIILKIMVSPSVASGILDECELNCYDIAILAIASKNESDLGRAMIGPAVAQKVAAEHMGTVLVARELEESHGHLICVTEAESSIAAAKKDAIIASRCACPVFLFSVARNAEALPKAQAAIDRAREAIEAQGIALAGARVAVGDPVTRIIEEGRNYSLIVLAASDARGLRRFFTTSVAYKVLENAENSVMIVR